MHRLVAPDYIFLLVERGPFTNFILKTFLLPRHSAAAFTVSEGHDHELRCFNSFPNWHNGSNNSTKPSTNLRMSHSKVSRWAVALGAAVCTAAAVYVASRILFRRKLQRVANTIIAKKSNELQHRLHLARRFVEEESQRPTTEEIELFSAMSIANLSAAQRSGKVTAVKILKVFLSRLFVAQEKTNCVVDLRIETAIRDAVLADGLLKIARDSQGQAGVDQVLMRRPLHGIVCSIKDSIDVKDADSTLGFISRALKPAKGDAPVVTMLRQAGAVVAYKGNVPQTLMSFECINPLHGNGSNPVDRNFTAGGSSGGDAAVVALRAASFAIGTDIGGSIRIPALFCGVAGIKCSQWRVPNAGVTAALPGQEAVAAVLGPIARHPSDLALVCRVIFSTPAISDVAATPDAVPAAPGQEPPAPRSRMVTNPSDGCVMTHPFDADRYESIVSLATTPGLASDGTHTRKLRIGLPASDSICPASPPCQRAFLEAKAALEKHANVEIVALDTARYSDLMLRSFVLFYRFLASDGCETLLSLFRNPLDTPTAHVDRAVASTKLPFRTVMPLVANVISLRDPFFAALLKASQKVSVAEYYSLLAQRNKLRHEFAAFLNESRVDAVLTWGFVTPACRHHQSVKCFASVSHTCVFNVLDSAAVAVPVTSVRGDELSWKHEESLHIGRDLASVTLLTMAHSLYEGMIPGLPVGVQIIARRQDEEAALACATILSDSLEGEFHRPRPN